VIVTVGVAKERALSAKKEAVWMGRRSHIDANPSMESVVGSTKLFFQENGLADGKDSDVNGKVAVGDTQDHLIPNG
jgi:hypothetical protein